MNEAALLAARKDKSAVDMRDFDEAIDRLIAGLEKKRVMNAKEREIVAYHESGHAIVATALPGLDPVHKISIVQRGFGALGYTMQLPFEDRYLMTRTDLLHQLAVLLAGRTAEEIALGEISTGAQNDLQRATDIARAMVTEFGMSDSVGAINYAAQKRSRFLDIGMPNETRPLRGGDGAAHRSRGQAHRDRVARAGAPHPGRAPRHARGGDASAAREGSDGGRGAARDHEGTRARPGRCVEREWRQGFSPGVVTLFLLFVLVALPIPRVSLAAEHLAKRERRLLPHLGIRVLLHGRRESVHGACITQLAEGEGRLLPHVRLLIGGQRLDQTGHG